MPIPECRVDPLKYWESKGYGQDNNLQQINQQTKHGFSVTAVSEPNFQNKIQTFLYS